ncbi:unnamed protein product [marine sediment metagenome]|uniref:Uncharacterized protein n=1 Tax=marine sediment metagenome TaxID=412755 RepID=X0UB70_9ZZZZ
MKAKTLEELRAYRYATYERWKSSLPYNPNKCGAVTQSFGCQCLRAVAGPNKLYCRQHAKMLK